VAGPHGHEGMCKSDAGPHAEALPACDTSCSVSPECKELLANSIFQDTLRALHSGKFNCNGYLGGMATLPSGAVHDVLSLGAPRAPNEEIRTMTAKGLGLEYMATSHELTRLLQAMCRMFNAPYGILSFFADGRWVE
jgi:hypothetical protein